MTMIRNMLLTATSLVFIATSVFSQPQIRVEPTTLEYNLPRYLWQDTPVTIYNDGNQPLTLSITDQFTGSGAFAPVEHQPILSPDFVERLQKKLLALQLEGAKPDRQMTVATASGAPEAIVITDATGDVTAAGLDIVSLDITDSFLTYDFELAFAGTPDPDAIAIISIDLDQNLATGEFPAPLGLGPGTFDIGAEYNVILDIGNFFGDTLGIPASAIVLAGGDTSLTPVGLPWPLGFSGNTVSVGLLKALFPIVDGDLNVAVISASLSGLTLPDLAPDYGHGLRGSEAGVSWMAQLNNDGTSTSPLSATIAAGDSLTISNRAVSVQPNGSYDAFINVSNNSANAPGLTIPVLLQIGAPATATINLDPAAFSDTLAAGSPAISHDVTISNSGNGLLVWFASDSTTDNGDWLQINGLPAGQVPPTSSANLSITIDPADLIDGQNYQGFVRIASNDSNQSNISIPVNLYIGNPTAINPSTTPIANTTTLYANYPNPFNPSTTIRLDLPKASVVSLKIFDIVGRHIETLNAKALPVGTHKFIWNATDTNDKPVSSGIYFYQLQVNDQIVATRKMILLK